MTIDVPPSELEIRISRRRGSVVLHLRGEIDVGSAPELGRTIDGAVDADTEEVVIDLAGVSFMDSSGLATLARSGRAAERGAHTLRLRRPGDQVRRLLELTGMLGAFTVEP